MEHFHINEYLTKDGGLYSGVDALPFIGWTKGNETIDLDGEFTVNMLRAIADVMEKEQTK